jgi:hypothetical protein
MTRFARLRVSCPILAALSVAALLIASGPAEAAPPSQSGASGSCSSKFSSKLNGYQPIAESTYQTEVGSNVLYLENLTEAAGGSISGTATYLQIISSGFTFSTGSFTGEISDGTIQVQGSVEGSAQGSASFDFSFTGTMSCLLSQVNTTDVATNPSGELPSSLQLTTVCELGAPFGIGVAASRLPACVARQILDGIPQPGWKDGAPIPPETDPGSIPYSWGAGHQATAPGPSYGTCKGYKGPKPCKAPETYGLDCSGFTRWIFSLIMSRDVLGKDGTGVQVKSKEFKAGADVPGDLVYFYYYDPKMKRDVYDHVGIVIAPGKMIDEPKTGAPLRVDNISTKAAPKGYGKAIYKAYKFPVVG